MASTESCVCVREEKRSKSQTLRFSTGTGKTEKDDQRGGKNVRYANTEHDAFALARYRCHAVVHIRSEARMPA
jgi:hypothetical protein